MFYLFLYFVPRGKRVHTPRALVLAVRGSLRRRSRLSHPAVRGSLRRRSRLSHPAVRGTSCRRSRLSHPAVRGSWRRRSRLCHPAVRGSSCRRSRIIQPSVPGGWRLHPRLTLARRPASDSMPAGLPLTQCPPACLWFQLARSAADSSSPDCRWLKLAGLPLTHATGRRQGRPTHHCLFHAAVCGSPTPPFAGDHAAVRGESQPTVGGCLWCRGESQPAVRGSLGPQPAEAPPARRPCRCVVKPAGCCHYLSSQPIMVSPDGRCRIDKPAGRGRIWPDSDHGLFNCFCVFSPGGLLIPLSFPKEILGGGSRAPAEETEVGAGAAVSEAVPPWPPELPAPPWPPELPAPPWPPELPAPPGPRSVCSTLEAPSCVCICVGPVGSPECPPPLPGSTVTARDVPSGRGELC